MVDIQSAATEIRRGKKRKETKIERNHGKNIMVCPIRRAAIIMKPLDKD